MISHRYVALNNKYSSLRHIYKRGFTSYRADVQTEIHFCSILDLEAGRLKSSMHVVFDVCEKKEVTKISLVPLDSCAYTLEE